VPAWYTNISQRLLKTPKILLNDTGIACALLDVDENRLLQDPLLRGRMLENFVGMELLKQIEFTAQRVRLSHFRTASGHEVDFVLEKASGEVVGVEVKASSRLDADDFRGLRFLQSVVRERWQVGVVFYTGTKTLPFGERLWAQPVNALWETA
jgi:predicted AAA+ superfamily ATPase